MSEDEMKSIKEVALYFLFLGFVSGGAFGF